MAIPANFTLTFSSKIPSSRVRAQLLTGSSRNPLPSSRNITKSNLPYGFGIAYNRTYTGDIDTVIIVKIGNVIIKTIPFTYAQNAIRSVITENDVMKAFPAAAAPVQTNTGTNTTGKPRYKVISPTQNGYYTEAVRELNERQIASMKQRGFKIDQVGGGFALQAAVRIPVLTHTTPQVSRRSRRGFVTGSYYNRGIATVAKNVIHRSERNPRLLFAESQRLFMVDMYAMKVTRNGVFVGLIQPIGIDQARKLRAYYKAKGSDYKTVLSRVSTTTNKITRTVTPDTSTQNPRTGTYAPKPIIGADSNLQRITQELKNLKAWIESINQRTSDQLIALGGATGDRQSQIDASNDRFEALNARISQQLIDLGNAASENAKSIAAQNAQRLLDDVKKTGGGGLGGITSFFTGEYSSYAILAVVAVVLLVMLKK